MPSGLSDADLLRALIQWCPMITNDEDKAALLAGAAALEREAQQVYPNSDKGLREMMPLIHGKDGVAVLRGIQRAAFVAGRESVGEREAPQAEARATPREGLDEVIEETIEDRARALFRDLCQGKGHSEDMDRAIIRQHLRQHVTELAALRAPAEAPQEPPCACKPQPAPSEAGTSLRLATTRLLGDTLAALRSHAEARATPREGLDQPVIELPERGTREDFARVTKYWRDRAIAAEAALRAPAEPTPDDAVTTALDVAQTMESALALSEAKRVELVEALREFETAEGCWCDRADATWPSHAPACAAARRAVEPPELPAEAPQAAQVERLPDKWDDEAEGVQAAGYYQQADRMRDCANELRAALAATAQEDRDAAV